ncbi:pentapeptide repeat-containing protein [Aliarcobacter butzleri]|uniref:pentapeptide repeat-containing protein n=2 Tax=Aliarcobacter butzleri TaxID=28197 RepID=UPI003B226279
MIDCQNCTDDKKCILHIEKSDYQRDFHKVGFLNEFYEELFNYVVDFEEIKKYIDYKPQDDEEELKSCLSKYFENQEVYFNHKNIKSSLDEYFKNETIVFDNIIFPAYKSRDKFNYMRIIKKLKKIHFNYCKFSATFLELKNIEVFFQDCEFLDSYSISNSDILENDSNVIYQMCIFHKDVAISKNDEEYKINHTLFSDCTFMKKLQIENIEFEKGVFNNTKYNEDFEDKDIWEINNLELKNCIVSDKFILENYTINKLDFAESTFKSKVKIQKCKINEAIFYNTKFKDLADFYQSKFKKVDFERTDFEKISVFSESEFNCDVDFKYVKFLGKSIFRDTVITGKLDLRNSIFDDEANFLDITSKERKKVEEQFIGEPTEIKVANRETARIIKNFYDNSNNIIEANRFYKLEMEKRREEFKNFPLGDYRTLESVIFWFHRISSNHSQSWFVAFFWIVSITFLFSIFRITYFDNTNCNEIPSFIKDILNISIHIRFYFILFLSCSFLSSILFFINNKIHYYQLLSSNLICLYLLYVTITYDYNLQYFSNIINPFSIMIKGDPLDISLFLYKIIIAYLIYQLIISIRQNTRRK